MPIVIPEGRVAQRGFYRAMCHRFLRTKSDEQVAKYRPAAVIGICQMRGRTVPDDMTLEDAEAEAARALAEQREHRGLEEDS